VLVESASRNGSKPPASSNSVYALRHTNASCRDGFSAKQVLYCLRQQHANCISSRLCKQSTQAQQVDVSTQETSTDCICSVEE
jgi:hypothetical protein